jgi:adenosylcobinamide kinase / adenosylcobinamide-phosphate guanylyltransferase
VVLLILTFANVAPQWDANVRIGPLAQSNAIARSLTASASEASIKEEIGGIKSESCVENVTRAILSAASYITPSYERPRIQMTRLEPTLVLGGARSGKSAFAEKLICTSPLARVYLATATAEDAEMQERIQRHRARRGNGWRTVEEPLALHEALLRESKEPCAILVDCLTLWLSNLMHAGRDPDIETKRLAELLRELKSPVVLVSNELGLGLVPETPLGRRFRDAQGRLNQAVAAAVPQVVFVAAGLPLWLKHPSLQPPMPQ